MVIVSPQDLGFWDPFQTAIFMAYTFTWGILTIFTNWDNPPSRLLRFPGTNFLAMISKDVV